MLKNHVFFLVSVVNEMEICMEMCCNKDYGQLVSHSNISGHDKITGDGHRPVTQLNPAIVHTQKATLSLE